MNLLIFRPEHAQFCTPDQTRGDLLVTGRQRKHLDEVHRTEPGDILRVGILGGLVGAATVTAIDQQSARLSFHLTSPPPSPLTVTMLLALPRPKMLKRTLQTIATMGVKQLYLINSYRVEKSYWQTPYLQREAIEEELLLGLEQGMDTHLPQVHLRQRFKPFVEDELPALIANKQALLAHPADDAMICPRSTTRETVVAIGPEGGFIPYEVTKLKTAGFTPVTLGNRILRVETAVPVILAKLFD